MDVKMRFLYEDLEEKVYIKQPEGFVMEGQETNLICTNKHQNSGTKSLIPRCCPIDSN